VRHQHPALLDIGCVELFSRRRAHQADDGEKTIPMRQRQSHQCVHIARLHEPVVVVARQDLRLRHNLMIEFDRAGPPCSRSLAHQIARAPEIEKLALTGGIDAARTGPALQRAKISVNQRGTPAVESLLQFLQRLRPVLGKHRRFIDRIKYSGNFGRIHHRALLSK
jgi:hypothetical protein